MRILRYLAQSTNPLNILLAAIVIVAVIYIILPLMKMNSQYSLPQAKPKAVVEIEEPQEKTASILPADYTVIGEHNLFHPERRAPADKKAEEVPKPELILYGTMIQDDVQYAFIEDKKNPKTTPGRGTRQTTVKKGDTISGYIISEIGTDRITLTKGDERMTVLLVDANKQKNGPSAQGPVLPSTPATARPGQASPVSPFGSPSTTMRPAGNIPTTQPQVGVPQQLPRPVGRGVGRTATQTTPESMPMP